MVVIYPYYRYYVDPDGTAYFTIAKRYATGDYSRAINGLWSPWSCWLTATMLKIGFEAMVSAVVVNFIGALAFVFVSNALLVHFNITSLLKWPLNLVMLVFVPYAIYFQLFDDIWQAFFLLCILLVMLRDDYVKKPALWVFTGFLAALAYFSKAYSFMFFGLNTIFCSFLITRAWQRPNHKQWLKICVVSVIAMIVFSSPWIYLLHIKYGGWMTSTAFKLNMSWYMVGHPYWSDNIKYLIPPTYPGSVHYWEDPYLVNGKLPYFWHSIAFLKMEAIRLVYMFFILQTAMTEVSYFFVAVWILAVGIIFSKKIRSLFPQKISLLALTLLVFPIGLIFKNAESRYMWYMLPISMVIGALVLQHFFAYINNRVLNCVIALVFAMSYILCPIMNLKLMFREGENDHNIAMQLKQLNVQGSFTANAAYGIQVQRNIRVAYFSGNPYYNIPDLEFPNSELLKELRRYHIKYYFFYYHELDKPSVQFKNESGNVFPLAADLPGLKVYSINP